MNVVGIDVGGARKGFHAVAISDGRYLSHFTTQDVGKLSDWCLETVREQVVENSSENTQGWIGRSEKNHRFP